MKNVEGKVAVVTGAASGIGRGMAETFAAAGMRVVLSDVERDALEATTAAVRATGADAFAVPTDVSKAEDIRALAEATLKKYGAVHILCNNAGVSSGGSPSWASTLDDWTWILGVNLLGVVHGMRTFLPIMIEQGEEAHVVNTASLAGLFPSGGTLYGTTKYAVVGLSENTQIELVRGRFKPRISVLCPGFVDTNILSCDRNRPAHLPERGPMPKGPEFDAFMAWFTAQLKNGLSPRAVGEHVLQAIREERFYVLTHPEMNVAIEHHMMQVMRGENPTLLPPG